MHCRDCKHRVLYGGQKVRTRGLTDKIMTYCYQQNTSFNEQQAPIQALVWSLLKLAVQTYTIK